MYVKIGNKQKGSFMKSSHKHILALAVSTVYIIAVYFLIGICFSTNDDRFMGELMSGTVTGKPEAHLVYVNYLLSLLLSLLYRLSVSVSWFGWLLIIFHGFSCFCILDVFYSRAKTKLHILLSSVLVCILFLSQLYLISQISYTMTAAFMAAGGYVCLILNNNKKSKTIYFIALELLAFLLRDKAMLMIQPLGFAVFFGLELIPNTTSFKTKLRHFAEVFGILVAILLVGILGNRLGYHGENWQTYNEYNNARTTLFDYNEFPPYDEVSHILDKYSVDEIDYNAYKKYTIIDLELSPDCVIELAEYVESQQNTVSFKELLNKFKETTFDGHYWQVNTLLICGYICVILFLLISKNFAGYIPLGFLALARTIVWLYLLYEGRFPLRISMPLFACELALLVVLVFYYYYQNKSYAKWQNWILALIGALFCIVGLWSAKIQFANFKQMNNTHTFFMKSMHEVMDYCNVNPDNRYIWDTFSFVSYNGEALDGTIYGKRNCITAGSWYSNAKVSLDKNKNYLMDAENGFYFIMLSEETDTKEELNHPTVLYLAKKSGSIPQIVDSFTASHGGDYSIIYFEGSYNFIN